MPSEIIKLSPFSGLPSTIKDYGKRVDTKKGGAQDPGEYGGWYQYQGSRVLFKQETKKKKGKSSPQNGAIIAEFLGSVMACYLTPGDSATVFLAKVDDKIVEDDTGTNVYLGSVGFKADQLNDFWEYAYLHDHPVYFSMSEDEQQTFREATIPKGRPKIVWNENHPIPLAMRSFATEDLAKMLGTALLMGDFDIHAGNIMVVHQKGERRRLKRIDFGWAFYKLSDQVHPHSRSRHPIGFGPTNHFRDYPRDLRISNEMANELERIATEVNKPEFRREAIDKPVDEMAKHYTIVPIRQFAQRLGVKDAQKMTKKESAVETLKNHLDKKMKARAKSLQEFASEIRVDLAIEKSSDGKFIVNSAKLDKVNEEYLIQRLFDGNKKFHFRKSEHKGSNFIDRYLLGYTQRDLKNKLFAAIKQKHGLQQNINLSNPQTVEQYKNALILLRKVKHDEGWRQQWEDRTVRRLAKNMLKQLDNSPGDKCIALFKLYNDALDASPKSEWVYFVDELDKYASKNFARDVMFSPKEISEIMGECLNLLPRLKAHKSAYLAIGETLIAQVGRERSTRCAKVRVELNNIDGLVAQNIIAKIVIKDIVLQKDVSDAVIADIISKTKEYKHLGGQPQELANLLKGCRDVKELLERINNAKRDLKAEPKPVASAHLKPLSESERIPALFNDIKNNVMKKSIIGLLIQKIQHGIKLTYEDEEIQKFVADINAIFEDNKTVNVESFRQKYTEFLTKVLENNIVLVNDLAEAFNVALVIHNLEQGQPEIIPLSMTDPISSLSYQGLTNLKGELKQAKVGLEKHLHTLEMAESFMVINQITIDTRLEQKIDEIKKSIVQYNLHLFEIDNNMQSKASEVSKKLEGSAINPIFGHNSVQIHPTHPFEHEVKPHVIVIGKLGPEFKAMRQAPGTDHKLPDILHYKVTGGVITSNVPPARHHESAALHVLAKAMVDEGIKIYGVEFTLEGSGDLLAYAQKYYVEQKELVNKAQLTESEVKSTAKMASRMSKNDKPSEAA